MAGAGGLAPVTERLESVLRSVHTQLVEWSEDVRELLLHTVAELQALLGSLEQWGDEERERVRALLERWDAGDRAATAGARVEGGTGDADTGDRNAVTVDADVSGEWTEPAEPTGAAGSAAPVGGDRAGSGEVALPGEQGGGTVVASVHEDQVVPISALFFDDAGPHVISAAGEAPIRPDADEDGVVPIEALLLRGSAAARAALALRPRLDQMLASGAAAGDLALVHDELFDLLELSISEATA